MGARSGLWGPFGRLGRLAGGVWGVIGDFGVVFGGLAAVFGGLEASWGDFGPILSLSGTPRKANVLIPDSPFGPPELCFLQISCSMLLSIQHALRPARRGRRIPVRK